MDKPDAARLRALPQVERLLEHPHARGLLRLAHRPAVVDALRVALAGAREAVRAGADVPGPEALLSEAAERLRALAAPTLRRAINATGVVLHTNLGRAPLPRAALAAAIEAGGYCNLELDLDDGRRGARAAGLSPLLASLTGAEGGLAVNNCAAAMLLALTALAGTGARPAESGLGSPDMAAAGRGPAGSGPAGGGASGSRPTGPAAQSSGPQAGGMAAAGSQPAAWPAASWQQAAGAHASDGWPGDGSGDGPWEVIVSRGELVEIGGGFRIPDVIRQGGARLVEVGTTNRTRLSDYAEAITPRTRLLLRVHQSNYRITGFTAAPEPRELAALAHAHGLLLLDDLGSGALCDLRPYGGGPEPTARQAVEAGADLVAFSGDKLLGGPQCGLLVGREAVLAVLRRHPLMRALRLDKLCLAALEATLLQYRLDPASLPVLGMLAQDEAVLQARAERLCALLPEPVLWRIEDTLARVGGGALPGVEKPSRAVGLALEDCDAAALARRLRLGTPAVVGRISADLVLLDMMAVPDEAVAELAAAVSRAAAGAVAGEVPGSAPHAAGAVRAEAIQAGAAPTSVPGAAGAQAGAAPGSRRPVPGAKPGLEAGAAPGLAAGAVPGAAGTKPGSASGARPGAGPAGA